MARQDSCSEKQKSRQINIILKIRISFSIIQIFYKILIQKCISKSEHFKSMVRFIHKGLIFVLLAIMVVSQQVSEVTKQKININELYHVSLQKGQTKVYTVEIKGLKKDESLFIQAVSPVYDPYQIPSVILKSENNFTKSCSQQNNQYMGICQVSNDKLKQGQQFDIQITCYQKCNLKLEAFMSETYEVDYGHKIQISALKNFGTVEEFKIKIPQDANYTDIQLIVTITNSEDVKAGVEMYVNVGDQTKPVPTPEDYMFKARQVWGSGVGVFLSKQQIKPGQWVKVFLVVGEGVIIEFYSQGVNGNQYQILLNTPYQDFTSQNQKKLYTLDMDQQLDAGNITSIQNRTIQITFVIYSGQPKILVGFDAQFKNYLQNYNIQGTLSYLITPQIRARNNFTGKIYVKVQSFWSSNYYFTAYTVSDKFYKITDGIAQINREQVGQIQNYIYESFIVVEEKEDPMQSYRLRIEIIEGNAEVGVRRCLSLQRNDTLDCIVNSTSELQRPQVQKTFSQIKIAVRKDWSAYQLLFQYNATQCQLYKQFGNFTIYNCQFQIVVFPNKNSNKQLVYSVTMFQNRQQSQLKEGYSYKDFLYSDTYHYYQFQLPSVLNVEEITFFLTIISGDAGIMGTTNQKFKFMQLLDGLYQEDIIVSFFNTLTFKKDKLAKKFYLGVYAYEASDITISLVVKRIDQSENGTIKNDTSGNQTQPNNTVDISTLYLVEGLSQQYTLTKDEGQIYFGFSSQTPKNITIQLIEIQGDVDFLLRKQGSDKQVTCNNLIQVGQLKCTFQAEQKAKYIVQVTGSKNDIQTFSISYFYPQTCKKYPFNLPQFVFLAAKDTQCSLYSVTDQNKSLQILTSFSTIDLLATSVLFTVTFNDNQTVEFKGRQKLISADQLKTFCKSDKMSNCNMQISYKGDQMWNVQFYFVVQQIGKEMALFDGIVRKVLDQKMTQKKGKYFYYQVTSMTESVKLFATNRDNVGYYIVAKFVQMLKFTASPDSLYLSYRDIEEGKTAQKENMYQTRLLPRKGTSVIQIEPEQFSKFCKACVMLVSVYGLQEASKQTNIFQLQVTQKQSFIYLGQQKTGFLSEDEVYVYQIDANPQSESLLTIRDFIKQSEKEKDCFSAKIIQIGTSNTVQIKSGYAIIKNNSASYKVFIQNQQQDICTYQISYSSLAKPVSAINTYMPTQVRISDSQVKYFLYNHHEQQSFRILNYIKSGDLRISANRVDGNNSIQNLVNKNIDMYDFRSVPGDSFLEVLNQSKFCKNCYYMIAIKGDPTVQSQMAIVKGDEAIGLTTYAILKQTLKKGETQTYAYYSIFDFNVSVPLLYGEVRVTVKSPEGKTLYNKTITMSTDVVVPRPDSAQGQYIDFYDQKSRFQIQVQAVKNSSYYISIKRKNVAMRIYEGVPVVVTIQNKNTTLQFVNMSPDNNVSVLISIKGELPDNFKLSVSAQVMKSGESSSTAIQNPVPKRSQNNFNFVFKSTKGTYFITFNSSQKVTGSLLLAKKKLTHLMSSSANLFTQKGAFEIYTPGNNLMIVIDSCLSQVQVKASDNYEAISANTTDKPSATVLLQHANYGGHYVITAQNVQGEYFVEVHPKNNIDNMLYIISYYYYDKSDDMPYKKVDIDPQISYQLSSDKIIFILDPVRLRPSKQKSKMFPSYTLFISESSNTSSMNSKCDLNIGFSLTQTTTSENSQPIRFPVDHKTIISEVGENTKVYYVSAKVKMNFLGDNLIAGYPPYIDLAYRKLQISQSTQKVEFKSEATSNLKYILLWIIVPILISLILFVLALKFCIKKYRMLYPDQLVQQDRQLGESQGQMKDEPKVSDSLTT